MDTSMLRLSAMLVLLPGLALAQQYTIDPAHTQAGFAVSNLVVRTVRGHFGKVTGTAELDGADFANAKVSARIEVASIDTENQNRDAHLRTPDFFDAARFPAITFVSTGSTRVANGKWTLAGQLTIRDVTKAVSLEVLEQPPRLEAPAARRFTASTKLHRRDFGVYDGVTAKVGNEVDVTLEVTLLPLPLDGGVP